MAGALGTLQEAQSVLLERHSGHLDYRDRGEGEKGTTLRGTCGRMDHSGDGGVEHDVCGVCAAWGARWRDRLEGGGREKI